MKVNSLFLLTILFASGVVFADESQSWRKLTDEAFAFYQKGKYKEAVAVTQKALEIAKQQFGPESLQFAESTGNLAALYDIQGKTAEAKNLYDKARAIRKKHGLDGIPLGLQSEAFFDKAAKGKANAIERAKKKGEPVMPQMEDTSDLRDLNRDGKVDDEDFMIFKKSLGKCEKDFRSSADVLADIDGNGCITLNDQKLLFPDR